MGIKGMRWSQETVAHLEYLRSRKWLATFADEDEAAHYAWTHPGAFVVSGAVYLDHREHAVFKFKKEDQHHGR